MRHITPTWNVVGAAVAGSSHAKRSAPCQDACDGRVLDNALVLAVADGAGSAVYSALGSSLAVREAVRFISENLCRVADGTPIKAFLRDTFSHVRQSLNVMKVSMPLSVIGDFSTTLLVVVVVENSVGSLQIGDGAIVLQTDLKELVLLSSASNAAYANLTTFVTSDDAESEAKISSCVRDDIAAIALVTDGIESVSVDYKTESPHHPFFDPLFSFVHGPDAAESDLVNFLESDLINEKTSDDKTIVLAARVRSEPKGDLF